MGSLHDSYRRILEDKMSVESQAPRLLRLVLRNRGFVVSDEVASSIAQSILRGEKTVEIPVDGVDQSLVLSSDDIERAAVELGAAQNAAAEAAATSFIEEAWPPILQSLYDGLPKALQEWGDSRREFQGILYDQWKDGLDRLDLLLTMAREARDMFAADLPSADEPLPDPVLIEVVSALQSRACQTAGEIICLLKAGYADGAHARWRSLYELAVTAFFLRQHPDETPQRFLDHAAIESYREAQTYQRHCERLGYDPYSAEEMEELRKASEAMIGKHGPSFKNTYGWAAEVLGKQSPTFTDIERSLNMDHWRPWFGLACMNVHAGSKSLQFSLGVPQIGQVGRSDGASNLGLFDPGHQTALSLMMITVALLTTHPNIDSLVLCQCMRKVCDDIGEELFRVHQATEEELEASSDRDEEI